MGKRVQLRAVTDDERQSVKRLAHLRTAPARAVERARDVEAALQGAGVEESAVRLGLARATVYLWVHRVEARGLAGPARLDNGPEAPQAHLRYASRQGYA